MHSICDTKALVKKLINQQVWKSSYSFKKSVCRRYSATILERFCASVCRWLELSDRLHYFIRMNYSCASLTRYA